MASKIKKFFKSKKNEAKFKLGMAGPGHRLGESSSSSQQSGGGSPKSKRVAPRVTPSAEAQQAAAAALSRLQRPDKDKPAFNT
jgi:UBX domain-containing protein 6